MFCICSCYCCCQIVFVPSLLLCQIVVQIVFVCFSNWICFSIIDVKLYLFCCCQIVICSFVICYCICSFVITIAKLYLFVCYCCCQIVFVCSMLLLLPNCICSFVIAIAKLYLFIAVAKCFVYYADAKLYLFLCYYLLPNWICLCVICCFQIVFVCY